MNDVEDKADIARANGSDPTPWMLIVFAVATIAAAVAIGIFFFRV